MAHRVVPGDGLRTSYAFAPAVQLTTQPEGHTSVRFEFTSSARAAGERPRVTEVTMANVVAYEWNAAEYDRLPSNPDDVLFALIEILDSPVVAAVLATRRYRGPGLAHYRLTFDDHGTYDIVCESVHTAVHPDPGEPGEPGEQPRS